jgi:hypothetical protein
MSSFDCDTQTNIPEKNIELGADRMQSPLTGREPTSISRSYDPHCPAYAGVYLAEARFLPPASRLRAVVEDRRSGRAM